MRYMGSIVSRDGRETIVGYLHNADLNEHFAEELARTYNTSVPDLYSATCPIIELHVNAAPALLVYLDDVERTWAEPRAWEGVLVESAYEPMADVAKGMHLAHIGLLAFSAHVRQVGAEQSAEIKKILEG